MAVARELLRRAEPANGGLSVDGEALTCELLKEHVQSAFLAHGALARGDDRRRTARRPRSATTWGRGRSAADDVVLLDLFPVDLESACFADMTRTFVVGDVAGARSASGTPSAARRSSSRPPRSGRA